MIFCTIIVTAIAVESTKTFSHIKWENYTFEPIVRLVINEENQLKITHKIVPKRQYTYFFI